MDRKFTIFILCITLVLTATSLAASPVSLSFEITPMLYTYAVAGFEMNEYRLELGASIFILELVNELGRQESFQHPLDLDIISKAKITKSLVMKERYTIDAGFGILSYYNNYFDAFTFGIGPSMECAWILPRRRGWTFKVGILLPVIFYNTHEKDPDNDFIPPGAFDPILLILTAPYVGMRYTF